MSPSWQSRNVPFGRWFCIVHGILPVPVKRRRALVATNPIEESRPELIGTMGRARSSRRALEPVIGAGRREAVPRRGLWRMFPHSFAVGSGLRFSAGTQGCNGK